MPSLWQALAASNHVQRFSVNIDGIKLEGLRVDRAKNEGDVLLWCEKFTGKIDTLWPARSSLGDRTTCLQNYIVIETPRLQLPVRAKLSFNFNQTSMQIMSAAATRRREFFKRRACSCHKYSGFWRHLRIRKLDKIYLIDALNVWV